MIIDENASGKDEVSSTANYEHLLIAQFYEDSVDRYGGSSEQARMFSVLLAEFDS